MSGIFARCCAIIFLFAAFAVSAPAFAQRIVTIDRLVSHASTVPAIKGQRADIFVREKLRDGRLVRARSGLPVDSAGDIAVHVEYADPASGQTRVITARAGIPCGVMNDGKTWKSLGLAIAESGGRVRADGLIEYPDGIRMHAIWPTGWTQTPFDHPLARNFIMRDHDGEDYVPDWCGDFDEAREGWLEISSVMAVARMNHLTNSGTVTN